MRSFMLIFCFLLAACSAVTPLPEITSTPMLIPIPPPTSVVVTTPTSKVEVVDSMWSPIQPGLEQRTVNIFVNGGLSDKYLMTRIDPNYFRFEIHYDADRPKDLATWAHATGAQVVVNGGYFNVSDEKYFPVGLFVEDGQTYGESFGDYAGMFTVNGNVARLYWLHDEPYLGEPYQFALQSFPMLVKPGGVVGFPEEFEDNMFARRTVIAQDQSGRFIFFVSDTARFTLHQLSQYLVDSDLDLDIALNLDGGPSSGMYILPSGTMFRALYELPIVITVHAR